MLQEILNKRSWLLADGATGTNYFEMGLEAGEPPEFWNVDKPEKVEDLHKRFIEAGADIILTNTFGCNKYRLKLHNAQSRVEELNMAAVDCAKQAAKSTNRDVIIAGSVGPTGELFIPLGDMSYEDAVSAFTEQIAALKKAGAHVAWIETMSSIEEISAAAEAANNVGMDYVFTASFDTAGKTMMGMPPSKMPEIAKGLPKPPIAIGANCGVGASDLLCSVCAMTEVDSNISVIAKANCGIPVVRGDGTYYTGTPELMADYAKLAIDSGAKIIGGCCGTSPHHLFAMRQALENYEKADRPSMEKIIAQIGPLVNPIASDTPIEKSTNRRSGRRKR